MAAEGLVTRLADGAFTAVVQTLLEGYIVVGGTVSGQMGMSAAGGGVDFVWDLWNEQFSAFVYPSVERSFDIGIGASAGVQVGFGTGRCKDVHDAWSGIFIGTNASITLSAWRIIQISGHIEGFSTPNGSVVGAVMGATVGASVPDAVHKLVKFPLDANVRVTAGVWTPNDALTRLATPPDRRRDLVKNPRGGHLYLDLSDGVTQVARHMSSMLPPPLALGLGAYASAVSMTKSYLESSGITDRKQALEELRSLLSGSYRRIAEYRREVPRGTEERSYDDYTVQRTNRGNFIITDTESINAGPTNWYRRLHDPNGDVLRAEKYYTAVDASFAPNGFIDGRSYNRHPSRPNAFKAEIDRRHARMMNE